MSKIEATKQIIKRDLYNLEKERRLLEMSSNKRTPLNKHQLIKSDEKLLFDLEDAEINVIDDDNLSLRDESGSQQNQLV